MVSRGMNYGWPLATLGTDYGRYDWPGVHQQPGRHDEFTGPAFAWNPSIGVSHLLEVRFFHSRWAGDILVASLKALSLFRLRWDGGRVIYSEPIWIGERMRDLLELADGTLVLWTDEATIWFLNVDDAALTKNERSFEVTAPPSMAACMSCHHLGQTNPSHMAPTLTGLLGKPVASDRFNLYSAGLKAVKGTWDRETLRRYVSDPPTFAPVTHMPTVALDAAQMDGVLDFLASPQARR